MSIRGLIALAIATYMIGAAAARAADDNSSFEKIERGRYLAVLGDCVACHTTPGGQPFAGGPALETPFGTLVGPNITPDAATGIGRWSKDEIVRYLKTGANSFDIASGPMAEAVENSTSHMTDADLTAITTYLKESVVRNQASVTALAADDGRMIAGKAIYGDRCGACHLTSGVGIPTLTTRLADAPLAQATDPTSLIRVVLMGSRAGATWTAPTAPTMPSFAWNLDDDNVANVLTYIRNGQRGGASEAQRRQDATRPAAA